MTPKFLREEAARFRGMAEEQTREASKLRLLGMADDYEARATAIDGMVVEAPEADQEPEAAETVETTGRLSLGAKSGVRGVRKPVARTRLRAAT
jgi:hypothetical protein